MMNAINSDTIFTQPWWLDAVAPGTWGEVQVSNGSEIVGRMPYVIKKRFGFKFISMPPLTQHLGPWLRYSSEKYASRLSEEKKILTELIDKLPRFDFFNQRLHNSITNWLPFYWRGFRQSTRYTYIIKDISDLEQVFQSFLKKTRSDIRRAEKRIAVSDDITIDQFIDLVGMTFKRQGKALPHNRELIHRLDEACSRHQVRKIFCARNAQGRIMAACYIVWDRQSAYYLMGGGDPQVRGGGANSLLIWEAIKFASTVTKRFDFEGSMVEPIERFFRSFGAEQQPYFQITKANSLLLSVGENVRSWWKAKHINQPSKNK